MNVYIFRMEWSVRSVFPEGLLSGVVYRFWQTKTKQPAHRALTYLVDSTSSQGFNLSRWLAIKLSLSIPFLPFIVDFLF